MTDAYLEVGGRTRWRRFALALAVLTCLVVALLMLIANGALAASFKVSGQQFKVSASHLVGEGFVNYGWFDEQVDGTPVPVAVAAMNHAELTDLCQSVLTTLPIVGDVSMRLTAGTDGRPVTAENLFIDMNQMDGDAVFTNIEIGRDASTLDKGPPTAQGLQGFFSQQADRVVITDLQQVAWATSAGTFRLNNLHLTVGPGRDECF